MGRIADLLISPPGPQAPIDLQMVNGEPGWVSAAGLDRGLVNGGEDGPDRRLVLHIRKLSFRTTK